MTHNVPFYGVGVLSRCDLPSRRNLQHFPDLLTAALSVLSDAAIPEEIELEQKQHLDLLGGALSDVDKKLEKLFAFLR
jgi:hypothetical protein